jgi:hypothetical protein
MVHAEEQDHTLNLSVVNLERSMKTLLFGGTAMSNPSGDYTFSGLGFTALRFFPDGSQYIGYLYYGEGSALAVSGATYTDATGVVTFSAGESPAGVVDLNFTGNVILDMSGNVNGISGAWTGRAVLANAPPAAAHAEPGIPRRPVIPILQANGAWAAFNRQDIIS